MISARKLTFFFFLLLAVSFLWSFFRRCFVLKQSEPINTSIYGAIIWNQNLLKARHNTPSRVVISQHCWASITKSQNKSPRQLLCLLWLFGKFVSIHGRSRVVFIISVLCNVDLIKIWLCLFKSFFINFNCLIKCEEENDFSVETTALIFTNISSDHNQSSCIKLILIPSLIISNCKKRK